MGVLIQSYLANFCLGGKTEKEGTKNRNLLNNFRNI
jgi:hypothetical protein